MNFRLKMVAACLLLSGPLALAGVPPRAEPCSRVRSHSEEWVAAQIDALVSAARASYESDADAAYGRVLDRIDDALRRCELSHDDNFLSRHRRFADYVEAASLDRKPDHELGFVVPDKQYFDETRQFVEIPDFLTAQGFLRVASRYETLARAKAYLRGLNAKRAPDEQLIFFSYTSRHLGTPDNDDSYRRLLVVVPGDASKGVPERWVQFGITDPGARTRIRNLSVVASLANADGTSNVYFKDFYRTFRRDGSITIAGRWELGYGDDNCVKCHKSGVLPVFPEAGSVSASEEDALRAANERFVSYGPPRFDKYLDASKLGPGLGSASADGRLRRFGASFGATAAARAMTCANCHRQERLGSLGWPMDRVLIDSYVKGGEMPLGQDITAAERRDLYDKLIREYFATDPANPGVLKSWLMGRTQ